MDVSKHTTFDCYLANSYFATRTAYTRQGGVAVNLLLGRYVQERVELVRILLFPYDLTKLMIVVVSESCWSL